MFQEVDQSNEQLNASELIEPEKSVINSVKDSETVLLEEKKDQFINKIVTEINDKKSTELTINAFDLIKEWISLDAQMLEKIISGITDKKSITKLDLKLNMKLTELPNNLKQLIGLKVLNMVWTWFGMEWENGNVPVFDTSKLPESTKEKPIYVITWFRLWGWWPQFNIKAESSVLTWPVIFVAQEIDIPKDRKK